jgi:hypothetical protein
MLVRRDVVADVKTTDGSLDGTARSGGGGGVAAVT